MSQNSNFRCIDNFQDINDFDDEIYDFGIQKCKKNIRNLEIITHHNQNFCRYPYNNEFHCKQNDIEFSSIQGIQQDPNSENTFLYVTPENRQKMIRCIDVPYFKDKCEEIKKIGEECVQMNDKTFFALDACCKCGGGRIFDTSRYVLFV